MAARSSETRYGTVAVTIHWLTAIMIVALLGSGLRAASLTDSAAKVEVLAIHVPLGIGILVLTLARIAWWWFADTKPEPVGNTPRWQEVSARAVHILFYIVILGMAASGIGIIALSGAAPIIRGDEAGPLPDFWDFLPRRPHFIGSRILMALFVLHVAAALYHHFFRRDGLLGRMWFSRGA